MLVIFQRTVFAKIIKSTVYYRRIVKGKGWDWREKKIL